MTRKLPDANEEWLAFLQRALLGLTKAGEQLKNDGAKYQAKRDWFRRKQQGIPRETSVSRALANIFNQMRSSQMIQGRDWGVDLTNMIAECEIPRPYDPGIADEANPTDFRLTVIDEELDLRIEAKTLLSDNEISGHYLGLEGLKRFEDSNNPYTIAPYGGMVAYVVDKTKEEWSKNITSRLSVIDRPVYTLKLHEDFHVSSHTYTDRESSEKKQVDVVHFTIEVDAFPSKRLTTAIGPTAPLDDTGSAISEPAPSL